MRVLLVVRWPVGGIRTFIRYVYRNFDPAGWRFTIVAPVLDEMFVLMKDLSSLDITWIPVRGIPDDGSSGFWKMTKSVAKQIAKGKYDLVHSHGFTSGMCTAVLAFAMGVPHMITMHETLNEKQFSGTKGRLKKRGMGLLFSLIDKVHAVSHDAKDNLMFFFPGLAKIKGQCVVIPNGIETERFLKAEPRNFRTELGLSDNVFLIGFFGRFMNPKGFRYLVDAMEILTTKELPTQPLVLAFGDGGFIREDKQSINNRGLESSFRFLPFTPNVAGAIKGVDVVAMPSLWEACGLLAMETLVSGTPLISSNCIGLREVVKDTPTFVVPKGDAASLAKAIEEEMKHSSREETLKFIETSCRRFDVNKTSQLISDVYINLKSSFF